MAARVTPPGPPVMNMQTGLNLDMVYHNMSQTSKRQPSMDWQLPTGPVWEAAKKEKLWCVYLREVQHGKEKLAKKPYGTNGKATGWNMHLGTFAEAAAACDAGGYDGVGYQPAPGSAMAVVDLDDVVGRPDREAEANKWIDAGGYWEKSSSGNGYHALIPRPEGDSEWTMDNAKGWVGYIGNRAKYVALTFDRVTVEEAAIEEVPGLMDFVREARNKQDEPDRQKALKGVPLREQWWLRLTPEDNRACLVEALQHVKLPPDGVDHGGTRRETWVAIMTALKASKSPYAEELFLAWSRLQPGYVDDADVERNWRDCTPDGRMSLLTLFHHAEGFDVKKWKAKARAHDNAEIGKKLAAALSGLKVPGLKVPGFEGPIDPEPEPTPETPRTSGWANDLMAQPVRPTVWFWDNMWSPGLNILEGGAKTGKSFIAMQAAEAIGTGQPLWGINTRKVGVLYYAIENGWDVTRERMESMGFDRNARVKFAFGGMDYEDGMRFDPEQLAKMLAKEINAAPDIGVIILDTARTMLEPPSVEGNAQDRDFALWMPIQKMALNMGRAIVGIDHTNKDVSGKAGVRAQVVASSGSMLKQATVTNLATCQAVVNKKTLMKTGEVVVQRMGRSMRHDDDIRIWRSPNGRLETITESMARISDLSQASRIDSLKFGILSILQTYQPGAIIPYDVLVEGLGEAGRKAVETNRLYQVLADLETEGVLERLNAENDKRKGRLKLL